MHDDDSISYSLNMKCGNVCKTECVCMCVMLCKSEERDNLSRIFLLFCQ